ncbi:MAG: hypothetical protein AB1634_16140 [Thermodesulfobacteriota bacterium]
MLAPRAPLYHIRYDFHLPERKRDCRFDLTFDGATTALRMPSVSPPPAWTELAVHQCGCCSLDPAETSHCPIAVNLASLLEAFRDTPSSGTCRVKCRVPERSYSKNTSLQEGLYSIFGVIMATSDCPVMGFLRPVARYHLPFASVEETAARVAAIYLLQEYFAWRRGRRPDLDLKKLEIHYRRVQTVNAGILARIKSVGDREAGRNALVLLHFLAQMLTLELRTELTSLAPYFALGSFAPARPDGALAR